jgi:hypothetical protein
MTRCRRPGPAPWRRRRRQRRCHHRRERQVRDDPEDHAPAVAIDFVVVVVMSDECSIFFLFIECRGRVTTLNSIR